IGIFKKLRIDKMASIARKVGLRGIFPDPGKALWRRFPQAAGGWNPPEILPAGASGREHDDIAYGGPSLAQDVAIVEGDPLGLAASRGNRVNIANAAARRSDEGDGLAVRRERRVAVAYGPRRWRGQPRLFAIGERNHEDGKGFIGRTLVYDREKPSIRRPVQMPPHRFDAGRIDAGEFDRCSAGRRTQECGG